MPYLRQSSVDCAAALRADTLNDNVAHALLAIEAEGHDAGWDAPVNQAAVFTVNAHPETSRVRIAFSRSLTKGWYHFIDQLPPNQTGLALVEFARLLHEGISQGDVELDSPPWPLHGYGIRAEMHVSMADEHATGAEAAQVGDPFEDADILEARAITFVDVNGNAWWVVRIRDEQPEIGAGDLNVEAPYSFTHGLNGLIASVLSRPFPER